MKIIIEFKFEVNGNLFRAAFKYVITALNPDAVRSIVWVGHNFPAVIPGSKTNCGNGCLPLYYLYRSLLMRLADPYDDRRLPLCVWFCVCHLERPIGTSTQ